MPKQQLPKIDELFSDPKYSDLADWFRGIFKTVMAEVASEETKKQKKPEKTFLDFLFNDDDDEEGKD